MLRSARFIIATSIAYAATLGIIVLAITSDGAEQTNTQSHYQTSPPYVSSPPRSAVVSGIPTHIQLPTRSIDLQVDPGYYDNASEAWTLSDKHAQYATPTSHANDTEGTTLIYGHATSAVFGRLTTAQLEPGTLAQVTSVEGTIFNYTFTHSKTLEPDDVTLFEDAMSGPPQLVLQTCTGMWSEWRTMYYFDFEGVVQS